MTKNISASSFGKGGVALALGAALLAAAMPAQAQWLVQDNNLYELIKNEVVDDQLKNINKKLDASGKSVGPYTSKGGAINDNTSTFNQLEFPLSPNTLLDPEKHATNATTFANSAKTYIGEDTLPNCNKEDETKRPVLYNNCLYARNIMGEQLRALRTVSQTLEARNRKLHSLMQNNEYKTIGELQKKQYELNALQAMMLNDNMRLQTTLAAFNATRDMYNLRYTEAMQGKITLKKDQNPHGKNGAALAAAQTAGRALLNTALAAAATADDDKNLKEKSGLAGGSVNDLITKGLGFFAK